MNKHKGQLETTCLSRIPFLWGNIVKVNTTYSTIVLLRLSKENYMYANM